MKSKEELTKLGEDKEGEAAGNGGVKIVSCD